MKYTALMKQAERRLGRPLVPALVEMVTEQGISETADQLGVSKATLSYWLLKLRIDVKRVALAPGDTLEVRRAQR